MGLVVALPTAVLSAAHGADGSVPSGRLRRVRRHRLHRRRSDLVETQRPGDQRRYPLQEARSYRLYRPARTALTQIPPPLPLNQNRPPLRSRLRLRLPLRLPRLFRLRLLLRFRAANPAAVPAAVAATVPAQTPAATAPAAIQASNPPQAPATTQAPVADASAQPAAAAAAPAIAPTPRIDDQVQLVARMLMDRGVIRAADDEPLPASPDAVDTNLHADHAVNGNNGNGGNCNNGNGECCYDNCCPPPPCLFWVAGVEATFLSPDLNSDGVSFEVEEIDDQRDDVFSTESTDTDSLYMSPRVWLGIQGCCWGVNLRYWHLQASEGQYDPSIGSLNTWDGYDCGEPDVGFFTCSRLEAYTVDLELTRRFCLNDCWMQASVGVRHAEIWANEGITGLAFTDEGLLNGFGRANRMSRGTGFLLGLYGRKPIFPCSCVNWFYNARWSALWGPTQTSAETFAAVQASDPDFVASAASVNGAYTTIDDTLFIGEIQLGLEWDYCLCCLPANAFFRVAVEYQRWDGGRGLSASDSFAGITIDQGVDPTSIVTTTASADEPQMDLLGFTIGTGLTW